MWLLSPEKRHGHLRCGRQRDQQQNNNNTEFRYAINDIT